MAAFLKSVQNRNIPKLTQDIGPVARHLDREKEGGGGGRGGRGGGDENRNTFIIRFHFKLMKMLEGVCCIFKHFAPASN